MAIPIEVQAGIQALGRIGKGEARGGDTGEIIMSKNLADYAQMGLDGKTWVAANQAAVSVSVALATTYTGLLLYNPVGSGKIVTPKFLKFAISVAPVAIATIGIIGGHSATGGVTAETTPVTVQSSQIGNGSRGLARVLSVATIVTPTWLMHLHDGFTAGALPNPALQIDLRGLFQILPGGFIAIGALTAITGLGSISWDEVSLTA